MPPLFRLNHTPTPLQALKAARFENAGIQVWIKRDDLNHPQIQGNKWHKLKLNLAFAQQQGYQQLLSFGGAYSNHIAALAAAGKAYGFDTLGYIRGDELANNHQAWSTTLKTAQQQGMQFHFLSRSEYRLRDDSHWLAGLQQRYPQAYILPEGGTNALAIAGFESLTNELHQQADFSHLLCAVGTGGSLAGFASYAQPEQQIWGIATLKQADYLLPNIQAWLNKPQHNWRLWTDFHGGGYGKLNKEIMNKYKAFEEEFNVLLDPVYTAKLVYGFEELLAAGAFERGSRVVLYHSGGLQGRH
jgi:1-aminocyclopropane-1-carboxylate deaminase